MAAIHIQKIAQSKTSVGPGETAVFKWNNPPAGTVLSFFANPFFFAADTAPVNFGGEGSLQIGKVTYTERFDKNAVPPHHRHVTVEVINVGDTPVGYDLYMSWVV